LEYTVTLGAAATQVTSTEIYASFVRIENEAGNALVKFGGPAVSAADYSGSVPADTATASNGVTIGPFHSNLVSVHGLYLLGTAAQKVHVTAVVA
jgi:hypothetical protein